MFMWPTVIRNLFFVGKKIVTGEGAEKDKLIHTSLKIFRNK